MALSDHRKIAEELLEKIDAVTEPSSSMTKGSALEVLELISTGLDSRMEALREEMKTAGQDWG